MATARLLREASLLYQVSISGNRFTRKNEERTKGETTETGDALTPAVQINKQVDFVSKFGYAAK